MKNTQKKNLKVGQYRLNRQIGKGSYGTVWLATKVDAKPDADGKMKFYAVKQLDKCNMDQDSVENLMSEVGIMEKITHRNIISLGDFMESPDYYYVVMEHCNNGDLDQYMSQHGVKHFDEEQSIYFLKQIASAFKELHKHQVMHRDFKIENIFLDNSRIVLGDLGFAQMGELNSTEKLGTPYYMAPEIFTGKTYTNKADLWAIGITYYRLLFGRLPFLGKDQPDLWKNILSQCGDNLTFPATSGVSEDSKDLIRGILQEDPENRITWVEFFQHRLFDKMRKEKRRKVIGEFLAVMVIKNDDKDCVMHDFCKCREDLMKGASSKVDIVGKLFTPKELGFKAAPMKVLETEEMINQVGVGMSPGDQMVLLAAVYEKNVERYTHEIQKIKHLWRTVQGWQEFDEKHRSPGNELRKCYSLALLILGKKAMCLWY
jgi:serine/threonine protein kinase